MLLLYDRTQPVNTATSSFSRSRALIHFYPSQGSQRNSFSNNTTHYVKVKGHYLLLPPSSLLSSSSVSIFKLGSQLCDDGASPGSNAMLEDTSNLISIYQPCYPQLILSTFTGFSEWCCTHSEYLPNISKMFQSRIRLIQEEKNKLHFLKSSIISRPVRLRDNVLMQ